MSYIKLKTYCEEKSLASLSNTKFLYPTNKIYFEKINIQSINTNDKITKEKDNVINNNINDKYNNQKYKNCNC